MLLVKAGTEIRGDDGQLVATITRDMHAGDIISAGHVQMADGHILKEGDIMPRDVWAFFSKFDCERFGDINA